MSERDENRTSPAPENRMLPPLSGREADAPTVLVPVSAEDFQRRRRRIILACAIAALAVAGIAAYIYKLNVDPIHARESFQSAERLYKIASYEQAILEFQHALSLDSGLAEAYLLMGRCKSDLTRHEEALPDFGKYIELRPNDPAGYLARASSYIELEKPEMAIADASRAIEVDPKSGDGYYLRGVAYRDLKEMDKALADMDKAVELDPTMSHYFERAATLQALDRHRQAVEDLNKVLEFAPMNAPAYHARALSYRALGDEASANRDHLYGRYLDSR